MLERIIQFCQNPNDPETVMDDEFGRVVLGSKIAAMLGARMPYEDFSPAWNPEEMSIESLLNKDHYVLYSGGKESVLTCKILDFFGISYKKIVFAESVKNISKEVIDEADIVLSSEIIEEYGNDAYGRHIPLVAYYVGVVAEMYPHSVIWVGAANVDENIRYDLGNADHSDIAFEEYMLATGCEVYSCINSLSEFDVYRIATDYFDYKLERSYDDNPDKIYRMTAFFHAHAMYQNMLNMSDKEQLMLFDPKVILGQNIYLKKPTTFDFRSDLRLFLASLDEIVNECIE